MKKTLILLSATASTEGGAPNTPPAPPKPASKDEQIRALTDEVTALRKQIAGFQAAEKQRTEDETIIAEKMQKGMTRQQAIQVIARQRAFDAERAKTAPAATPPSK